MVEVFITGQNQTTKFHGKLTLEEAITKLDRAYAGSTYRVEGVKITDKRTVLKPGTRLDITPHIAGG